MLPALCVKYIFGAIHNWNTTVMFLWIIQDAFFHLKAAGGGGSARVSRYIFQSGAHEARCWKTIHIVNNKNNNNKNDFNIQSNVWYYCFQKDVAYTTVKMFEVGTIFLMILKSTYLIKNNVKTVILWNKYNLK